MFRRLLCLSMLGGLVTAFGVLAGATAGSASPAPSGQVMYGNTTFDFTTGHFVGGGGTIEPAYNDGTGALIYLQTPNNAHVHGGGKNVAPLYLPMYPVGSGIDPASLNCPHVEANLTTVADKCPDHGPLVAGVAESAEATVYSQGVLGHDHLAGIASSGGDFNVIWEPILVVFTSVQASMQHITTLAQVNKVLGDGEAIPIPIPQAEFHCSVVSAAAYARGTPAPTVGS